MMVSQGIAAALTLALAPAPATAAPAPQSAAPSEPDRAWADDLRASRKTQARPVANLPDARGRTFTTLDAYLAHLRTYAAPVDRPWWREVRPGVFRLETNMRGGAKPERLWTRTELERKFGFRE